MAAILGDKFNRTQLMYEIMYKHWDRVRELIVLEDDINYQDSEGNSALHWLMGNRIEKSELKEEAEIAKRRNLPDYKFLARSSPPEDILQMILDKGADENLRNRSGHTPKDAVWESDINSWVAKSLHTTLLERMLPNR